LRDYAHQVFGSLDGSQMAWSCWMKASFAAKRSLDSNHLHTCNNHTFGVCNCEVSWWLSSPIHLNSNQKSKEGGLNMKKPERFRWSVRTPL
jgi:hypothetical protein